MKLDTVYTRLELYFNYTLVPPTLLIGCQVRYCSLIGSLLKCCKLIVQTPEVDFHKQNLFSLELVRRSRPVSTVQCPLSRMAGKRLDGELYGHIYCYITSIRYNDDNGVSN